MSTKLLWALWGILLYASGTVAGQELIPNGGFETYRNCPRQDNVLSEAVPWYNPNQATPDFYNQCFPTAQIELPPHSGRGLGRLFLDQGWAEYMATPLKKPLEADKCYYFEMYVATPAPNKYIPGNLGAYLSAQPLTATTTNLLTGTPQILDSPYKSVTTRFQWERISQTFKAKGGEQYVTIGAFSQLPVFLGFYYIFLDDISLKPIEFSLGNDTTLCGRQSTLLLHADTPGATAYRWNDGSTASTFRVTKAGTYSVTVTTPCTVLHDTIKVDYALPFTLGADTTLCNGQSLTLHVPANAPAYKWQDGSVQNSYLVNRAGTYSLQVSQAGCVAADTIQVRFIKPPQLELGPDKELCGTEVYDINPTFAEGTFAWKDTPDPPERTLHQSGVYRATVSNACATVTDSVAIDYGDCGCVIYAPGGFTPNADGQNDLFQPLACGDITMLSLTIFNRWGAVIFQTDTAPFQWDGQFNNLACPAGAYAWKIEYVLHRREKVSQLQKQGTLVLIR